MVSEGLLEFMMASQGMVARMAESSHLDPGGRRGHTKKSFWNLNAGEGGQGGHISSNRHTLILPEQFHQ